MDDSKGIVLVWKNTNTMQIVSLKEEKEFLARVKYTKEFLHFYKRIDDLAKVEYSTLCSPQTPLHWSCSRRRPSQ